MECMQFVMGKKQKKLRERTEVVEMLVSKSSVSVINQPGSRGLTPFILIRLRIDLATVRRFLCAMPIIHEARASSKSSI